MENGAIDDLLLKSMANRMSRKRTNRTRMKRAFAIAFGIIVAIMISGSFQAHAMSVSAPMPNGVGLKLKFPLHGVTLGTESAEVHVAALHNRTRMMRVEAPIHGRFVRFKVAQMKYVMRFANPAPRTYIAPPASQDRLSRSRPKPLYRKAAFTISNIASSSLAGAPPAHYRRQGPVTASGALPPSRRPVERRKTRNISAPHSASDYRVYAKMLALRYGKMRQEYMQLRVSSPRAAKRAYGKLMKFYALAKKWQRYAN